MTATAAPPKRTRKPKAERKNQFNPEQLEQQKPSADQQPPVPPPATATDAESEPDPERADLERRLAELQAERDKYKSLADSSLTWKRKLQVQQGKVSAAEAKFAEADAARKKAKAAVDAAVADELAMVAKFIHGEQLLPLEDADKPDPAPTSAPAAAPAPITDQAANEPVSVLSAKNIKKIAGADVFDAAKARGEPIGLSEKQVDAIEAAGWSTIGALEKAMRENQWWWKEIAGFGENKVSRLNDTLAAFRRVHPMPVAEPVTPLPPTEPQAEQWEQSAYHLRELIQAATDAGVGHIARNAQKLLETVEAARAITVEQLAQLQTWTDDVAAIKSRGNALEAPEWETVAALLDEIATRALTAADVPPVHTETATAVNGRAKTFAEAVRESKTVEDVQRDWIKAQVAQLDAWKTAAATIERLTALRDEANKLAQHGPSDALEPCEQIMVAAVQMLVDVRRLGAVTPEIVKQAEEWSEAVAQYRPASD